MVLEIRVWRRARVAAAWAGEAETQANGEGVKRSLAPRPQVVERLGAASLRAEARDVLNPYWFLSHPPPGLPVGRLPGALFFELLVDPGNAGESIVLT
jgi:hypothetical protein